MHRRRLGGLLLGAGSGLLYGSINVLAKPIDLHPFWKAAVAYLASAAILLPWTLRLRVDRRDWPRVLAMGLLGGGVAPVLLFYGLQETAAADAGLLLSLEMVATATLAFAFLHERFPAHEVAGLLLLLGGAVVVAFASGGQAGQSSTRGVLLVMGAAVAWGVDNAVSAHLAGNYPLRGLIGLKGMLGGGAALLGVAVVRPVGPGLASGVAMAGLGVVSIAVSSLLFYTALRRVGAARTSAMNIATTALVGAAGGAVVLAERLGPLHVAALLLVLLGTVLLARGPAAPFAPGVAPPPKPS